MLKEMYVCKDGKRINLAELSFEKLEKLNLEEEIYFAKEIKKRKAFSKERNDYLKNAYEKIFQIADWKKKVNKSLRKGNGVTEQTIDLLQRIITNSQKKNKKVLVYEAGVGKGEALKYIKNKDGIIKGCDVFLSQEAREIERIKDNIELVEENIYNALDNIKDEEIDIFYADNVLEHIVPDEYEEICKKISKKMKKNSLGIFIIPNSYVGPNDISRKIVPLGGKAKGFHFMEQSFMENVKIFNKYNLKLQYFCWRDKELNIHFFKNGKLFNFIKLIAEKHLGKIKNEKKRKRIFKRLAYEIYIVIKK